MYWPAKLQQGENELRKVSKLRLKWPEVKIGMAFKKDTIKRGAFDTKNLSKSYAYEKYFGKKYILRYWQLFCAFSTRNLDELTFYF